MAFGGMGDVAGPGGGGANVSAGGIGFGGDIGHGDVGHGSGQVDPGLAAAAGGPGAGSGLGQSVGSASAGGAGGEAEAERSIAAFRSAIARALGLSQIDREVTYGAPAQPGSPALEAHDMDTDAVRNALEAAGMFDDPSNTDYSDDSPAYDPDAVNRQVYGAPQTLDDPQGTQEGLNAAIAANTANFNPSYNEREVNKQVYGETDVVHNVPKGARGFEVVTETEKTALPYSQMDQEERRNFYGKLNQIRQATRERQTPFGKAVHAAFSTALGFSTVNNIGKAVKAALDHLGFNVNPNEVEQAARHAFEVSTQGPLGAGGTSVGARNDSFIENFLANLPADEPWMKGLTERQIQYYLDRPSELEWVRNLYSQMNPSEGMGQ